MGEEKRIPRMMRIAIVPVVLVSILATLFLILLAEPLAHLVLRGHADVTGITPGSVAVALRGLAIMLPFAGLLNAYLGASRGYGDMRPSAWVGQIGLTIGRLIGILRGYSCGGVGAAGAAVGAAVSAGGHHRLAVGAPHQPQARENPRIDS